jgi:hypothetical protein
MTTVNDAVSRYRTMTTQKLLEYEGEDIALNRPPDLIDDGAGGKKRALGGNLNIAPQRFFVGGLVTMGRGVATQPERWIITSLGERYREFAVLIGLPDADVQEGDWFSRQENDRWEVLFIHDDRSLQTKVEVGRV